MAIERKAHATWEGDLRSGSGTVRPRQRRDHRPGGDVRVALRAEPGGKTSPEELIAAAHATCVSMALANGLAQDGHPPTKLETDAVCTLDQTDAGFRITTMQLTVRGEVDGIGEDEFQAAAQQAKEGCPVSNALGHVEISLEASLA